MDGWERTGQGKVGSDLVTDTGSPGWETPGREGSRIKGKAVQESSWTQVLGIWLCHSLKSCEAGWRWVSAEPGQRRLGKLVPGVGRCREPCEHFQTCDLPFYSLRWLHSQTPAFSPSTAASACHVTSFGQWEARVEKFMFVIRKTDARCLLLLPRLLVPCPPSFWSYNLR